MTELRPNSPLPLANEDSCDSDSDATVILKDDESVGLRNTKFQSGLSFARFISFHGNGTTDGDIVSATSADTSQKPYLTTLSSELSFLQNNPYVLSATLPPGSFMFTDCRIQMAMDERRSRQVSGNDVAFSAPTSSSPESSNCSSQGTIQPASSSSSTPPPARPLAIKPSLKDVNRPNDVHLSELRCKNREAARKCRAKKKNYIQQLEHNYKELKMKYALCQQENDDLKRFIFHHIGVNLTPKPGNPPAKASPAIAPVQPPTVPVVVNVPPTTPVHVFQIPGQLTRQPVLVKVMQPPKEGEAVSKEGLV
uniref:BZIP domain-containing protein n=1 Tax=Mesocestoides corti TaxID=53468 RepID=A0A5K3F470_MESCO